MITKFNGTPKKNVHITKGQYWLISCITPKKMNEWLAVSLLLRDNNQNIKLELRHTFLGVREN
jgi:hypothetical protein